jgi:hypothetical protein
MGLPVVGNTLLQKTNLDLAKITLATGANLLQAGQRLGQNHRLANQTTQVEQRLVQKSLLKIHY